MSLKKQLARYKQHLSSSEENKVVERSLPTEDKIFQAIQEAANQLGAEVRPFQDQFILVKTESIPLSTRHGNAPLSDIFQAVDLWQECTYQHPLSTKGIRTEKLLFFSIFHGPKRAKSPKSTHFFGFFKINIFGLLKLCFDDTSS